jgi:hypothetical protein
MSASELLRTQHGVHEIRERRHAQQQGKEHHRGTYTRSQNSTNAAIAANAINPISTITRATIAVSRLRYQTPVLLPTTQMPPTSSVF